MSTYGSSILPNFSSWEVKNAIAVGNTLEASTNGEASWEYLTPDFNIGDNAYISCEGSTGEFFLQVSYLDKEKQEYYSNAIRLSDGISMSIDLASATIDSILFTIKCTEKGTLQRVTFQLSEQSNSYSSSSAMSKNNSINYLYSSRTKNCPYNVKVRTYEKGYKHTVESIYLRLSPEQDAISNNYAYINIRASLQYEMQGNITVCLYYGDKLLASKQESQVLMSSYINTLSSITLNIRLEASEIDPADFVRSVPLHLVVYSDAAFTIHDEGTFIRVDGTVKQLEALNESFKAPLYNANANKFTVSYSGDTASVYFPIKASNTLWNIYSFDYKLNGYTSDASAKIEPIYMGSIVSSASKVQLGYITSVADGLNYNIYPDDAEISSDTFSVRTSTKYLVFTLSNGILSVSEEGVITSKTLASGVVDFDVVQKGAYASGAGSTSFAKNEIGVTVAWCTTAGKLGVATYPDPGIKSYNISAEYVSAYWKVLDPASDLLFTSIRLSNPGISGRGAQAGQDSTVHNSLFGFSGMLKDGTGVAYGLLNIYKQFGTSSTDINTVLSVKASLTNYVSLNPLSGTNTYLDTLPVEYFPIVMVGNFIGIDISIPTYISDNHSTIDTFRHIIACKHPTDITSNSIGPAFSTYAEVSYAGALYDIYGRSPMIPAFVNNEVLNNKQYGIVETLPSGEPAYFVASSFSGVSFCTGLLPMYAKRAIAVDDEYYSIENDALALYTGGSIAVDSTGSVVTTDITLPPGSLPDMSLAHLLFTAYNNNQARSLDLDAIYNKNTDITFPNIWSMSSFGTYSYTANIHERKNDFVYNGFAPICKGITHN